MWVPFHVKIQCNGQVDSETVWKLRDNLILLPHLIPVRNLILSVEDLYFKSLENPRIKSGKKHVAKTLSKIGRDIFEKSFFNFSNRKGLYNNFPTAHWSLSSYSWLSHV